MKDLTLTQEYFICAVNEKGKLSSYKHEPIVCLIVSGILELQLEKCICIKDKKISVCAELPTSKAYLKPLYDVIGQKDSIKMEKVVETYTISFTDKKLQELKNSIVAVLIEADAVTPVKSGLWGNKESYAPKTVIINSIVEKIRAELLEDGAISEEAAALTSLLDKAGFLKEYFSNFERKALNARLNEIRNSETGTMVKEMMKHIDGLMAVMMVTATVP